MEVKVKLFNPLRIQIRTEDTDYMEMMKEEFTSYVEGFRFMPQYRAGGWNGRVCMINKFNHTLPYGLLMDLVRVHKKKFRNNRIVIDDEVKNLFKGPKFRPKWNLSLEPYPYQRDCILASLNHTKGIIKSATASGKSLVIAYIIRTLLDRKKSGVKKAIIVVSGKSLMEQFYKDLSEYGFDPDILGRVYAKKKEWEKQVVISTWQSLSKNHKKLDEFEAIIVDEVHGAKAHELKKILSKSAKAKYRLGFTGTLHATDLDNWNVKSYLGPVIREYPAGLLAEQGYISKCNIKMLNVEYVKDEWEGSYDEIKDEVFQRPFRLELMGRIVESVDHNILMLVGKVEKEGDFLKDYLMSSTSKEVVFISGRDGIETREKWRAECGKRKNIALIATYGIFQQGINIPSLKYIILASPFKAKIRVLQSVGRALRKHADKEEGAIIFDIHDHTKFFGNHGNMRLRFYDSENFDIKEYLFEEGRLIETNELFLDL